MKDKRLLIVQAPCTIPLPNPYKEETYLDVLKSIVSQFDKSSNDFNVILLVKDKLATNAYDWEWQIVE